LNSLTASTCEQLGVPPWRFEYFLNPSHVHCMSVIVYHLFGSEPDRTRNVFSSALITLPCESLFAFFIVCHARCAHLFLAKVASSITELGVAKITSAQLFFSYFLNLSLVLNLSCSLCWIFCLLVSSHILSRMVK